jgi:hypothetical protein
MGLFSSKREVSTEEFCRDYYDNSIFEADLRGLDPWEAFCQSSYKMILEADPQFQTVDFSAFASELRALRLEVFSTAWLHSFKDRFAPYQSEFTKQYLENHSISEVWEQMGDYNQAVARSTAGNFDPNSRSGRAALATMDKARADKFEHWINMGYDPDTVARVANRTDSDYAVKSSRLYVYLSFALTDRLNCDVNEEARGRLISIIRGFYEGAKESLKEVKITARDNK